MNADLPALLKKHYFCRAACASQQVDPRNRVLASQQENVQRTCHCSLPCASYAVTSPRLLANTGHDRERRIRPFAPTTGSAAGGATSRAASRPRPKARSVKSAGRCRYGFRVLGFEVFRVLGRSCANHTCLDTHTSGGCYLERSSAPLHLRRRHNTSQVCSCLKRCAPTVVRECRVAAHGAVEQRRVWGHPAVHCPPAGGDASVPRLRHVLPPAACSKCVQQ